jgi:hypothetical protein
MMDMSATGSGAMDMSAVGSGALEASFRANPVANRRADAPPRLNPYMWSTLPMVFFEHSNEARVKKKQGLIPNHTNISVGFGESTHSRTLNVGPAETQ